MNALARIALASVPTLLTTGGPWLSKLAFFGVFALSPVPGPLSPPSWLGKLAFIGVFVVLLVWLLFIPDRMIGNVDGRPPWWRNARFWAILVCVIQILVYLRWG